MSITRWRDGGVTVTLSGDIEHFVRRAVDVAAGTVMKEMQAVAEQVAKDAEATWYDDVKRRTGMSGKWDVVTTVSRTEVQIGVASLDTRSDRRGRIAAWFVHRPGPLSVVKRAATRADFKAGRALASPPGQRLKGRGVVVELNPAASDGKYLLGELVRKPFRVKVKVVSDELGQRIVAAIRRGS